MKTIWKFPLSSEVRQVIHIPEISHFLQIGKDDFGQRCLWFAVDSKSKPVGIEIVKIATGREMPHVGDYLGTIVDGQWTWHYFCGPDNVVDHKIGFHYFTRDTDG